MSWVIACRFNNEIEEKDLTVPAIRFYRGSGHWDGTSFNCKKWESAEEALNHLESYYGYDRKELFKWMTREMLQLEQL